jgi:hypothetical protein
MIARFDALLRSEFMAQAVAGALGLAFKTPREAALQIARSSQLHLPGQCLIAACLGTVAGLAVVILCCAVEMAVGGGR